MKQTKNKKFQAFTLVELIIVITILAILATIAFLSFSSYTAKSKDSGKLTTLKNLQSGLDIFQINTGKYPLPDGTLTSGFIDGNEVAKKGILGENIASLIKISPIPTDPLNGANYVYGISQNAKEYQLATVLETDIVQNSPFPTTLANTYKAKVVGNYKGYLEFQSGSQTYVANIPSLLFTFTGSNVNLLNGNQVFFITDKEKNLPYNIGDTPQNTTLGNISVQQRYGDTATLTKIDITDIKAAKTPSEKLIAIEALGDDIKNFGITSAEEFLNVAENKPLVITQTPENIGGTTPVSCPENPTAEEFFTFNAGTIVSYSGSGPKDVVIPCKIGGVDVTIIGPSAFMSKQLTSVIIPNTVTTLSQGAFRLNTLTQIVIPDSVTSIGANAFAGNQLTSVTLSKSAFILGGGAFANNKLTSIDIPNGVTTLSNLVFNNNLLTSVTLPNSVTSIGINAFANNPSLTSVTNFDGFASPYIYMPFEDGIKIIGVLGTVSTNLTIPSTLNSKPVKFIGDSVFYNKGLSAVVIPNSVNIIGTGAFQANLLTNLEIPSSVHTVSNTAFSNNQLTSVIIPNSVTTIGNSAFVSNKLNSVTLTNASTTLGNNTFSYQDNAAGFGSISYASEGQKNTYHNTTYVDTTKLPYGIVGNDTSSIPNLNCPENPTDAQYFTFSNGTITGYSDAGPKNVIIPCQINGVYVTTIGQDAFYNKQLTYVTIPNSVSSIKSMGFYNNQLTSVNIPSSVTSVGDYAFYFNQITSVTIPNSITSIGNYTFGSNQLTSVTIPNSITSIGNNAFESNQLTSIIFPSSVNSVGSHAFASNSLTNISISNPNMTIGSEAFSNQREESVTRSITYASVEQKNTYYNSTYINLLQFPTANP